MTIFQDAVVVAEAARVPAEPRAPHGRGRAQQQNLPRPRGAQVRSSLADHFFIILTSKLDTSIVIAL